jgi:hypothetical protein
MEEIVARLGDVHKRIDDLRGDMTGRADDLRADMTGRLDDFRSEVSNRFTDLNQRFTTLMWVITAWFSLLTVLMIIFKLIKP